MVQEWEVRQITRGVKMARELVGDMREKVLRMDAETASNALLEASCKLSEAIGALSVVDTE